MNEWQCKLVVESGHLLFVDNEYCGTIKLTNLDNGETNMSFPGYDDGLITNILNNHQYKPEMRGQSPLNYPVLVTEPQN